jgi:hypothetical protein
MFNSPEQALAFAFRIRDSRVISLPSATHIAQKVQNQVGSTSLTRYDLHAQAGMIFSFLSRRPEQEQAYAFYLYGSAREKRIAADWFARKYSGRLAGFGLSKPEIRRAIQAKSVRHVSSETGLTQWKSWKLRREIADVMAPACNSLMDALWIWLTPNSGEMGGVG